jgi:hypothetical protein
MAPEILTKADKRSGVQCWAVAFADAKGLPLQTGWTTYEAEAAAWAHNIALTGWTTEGRPGPRVEG